MSVLTDIAALLRTKFNEQRGLINGKEPAVTFTAGNQYFGTDAGGMKGIWPLPAGAASPYDMWAGVQFQSGGNAYGGYTWTKTSTGAYSINKSALSAALIHAEYKCIIIATANGAIARICTALDYPDSVELRVYDAAGQPVDNAFAWMVIALK